MSYKAIEIAAELADKLAKRLTLAVVQSFDANGNPIMKIGAGTAGAAGAVIRVKAIDWSAKDVLGLTSTVYTPHVCQVVTEKAAANDMGINDWSVLGPMLSEVYGCGTRVEFYAVTNTTAMNTVYADVDTYIVAGNLKSSVEHDLYKGMLSSQ